MKCTSCGAEIGNRKVCEYCGTHISAEMQKEQEQLNKPGCPKCGSTDIQFARENAGEILGKNHKQVVHQTVGYCNNCGYTWYPLSETTPVYKKRKTWLWVLGWLFCFPVPLTILLLRKKEMKPLFKYGIIAIAWIIYIIIGLSGDSDSNSSSTRALSDTENATISITKLSFPRTNDITLKVGEKTTPSQIYADVKRNSDFSSDDVLFVSDNPDVATIAYDHDSWPTYLYYTISAVGPGETTVYATSIDGSVVSEKIKVIVPEPIVISSIDIKAVDEILALGEKVALSCEIEPKDAEDRTIIWSSSDDSVLQVDEKGKILAIGGGTASITASSNNGVSSSIEISVDGSKHAMNLHVTRSREDDNNIGDEWSYFFEINGEPVNKIYRLSAGDKLKLFARFTESDDKPDVGETSKKYVIKEEDFINGFSVSMDVYVKENGGRNKGNKAHFIVTFDFTP